MESTTIKKLRTGATEAAVGSLLALVFLGVLLVALNVVFPDATGIGELARAQRGDGTRTASLDMRDFGKAPVVAYLTDVHNTVKDRPSSSVTWSAAGSGLPLTERHSVQSYGRSGATIVFDAGSRLSLGENTLLVVRSMTPSRGGRARTASLMFVEGEMRGILTDASGERTQLELVANGATVRAAPGHPDTDFKVASGPDDSTTLMVYEGQAEVLWGDETTIVEADYAVDFSPTVAPGTPRRLPATPLPVAPADGQAYTYRGASPEVGLRWFADEPGLRYRLQIARDPEFEDVVYEGSTDRMEFVHGGLDAGMYSWRVTALRGLVAGRSSVPQRFAVLLDRGAPTLQVAFPPDSVTDPTFVLRGVTEPGSAVLVGKLAVEVAADGSFEHRLELRRGYNVVVIQAVDPLGNASFESKLIDARY